MIRIEIIGDPIAAPRPRVRSFNTRDGRLVSSTYNPRFYEKYRDVAKILAMEAAAKDSRCPYTGACSVEVEVFVPIPASMSAKKQRLAETRDLRPITRPDVDNYLKTAFDLLSGIIFKDDSLVVSTEVRKFYAYRPRMVIMIDELAPNGRLL